MLRRLYAKVQRQTDELVVLSRALDLKAADVAMHLGLGHVIEKRELIDAASHVRPN